MPETAGTCSPDHSIQLSVISGLQPKRWSNRDSTRLIPGGKTEQCHLKQVFYD
jgi:hypothetical protein